MDEQEEVLSRDRQRELMRERTEEVLRITKEKTFQEKEKLRISGKVRDIVFIVTFVFVLTAAGLLFYYNYPYSTYQVKFEKEMSSLSNGQIFNLGKGTLVVGQDSFTYLEEDQVVWTSAISLNHPIVTVSGDYFSVYNLGGYDLYVCDTAGMISTVQVSREIHDTDISDAGAVAVLTESNDAAYISYFDKFGNRLPVEVKTLLNASGYPLDISVSPNGQRLAVVSYSTVNGIGESRLLVYDFEKGKPADSYVIAEKEDFYDTDTVLVDVEFLDNDHAVAVGDNMLCFFDQTEKQNKFKKYMTSKNVLSAFQTPGYFGLVEMDGEKAYCNVFDVTGKRISRFECPSKYTNVIGGPSAVLFIDHADLHYYSFTGKNRYNGTLPEKPVAMLSMDTQTFVFSTESVLEKIRLK